MERRSGWIPPTVLFVAILALWEGAVRVFDVPEILLPMPSLVIMIGFADAAIYLKHSWITGIEVFGGYFCAVALGAAFGLIIAFSKLLGGAIYPTLVAAQIMPKVAIAPLLVVWFGFDLEPKLVLTALIGFFPVVINTIIGLHMTSRESVYLFRSMGATTGQTFFKLRLPNSLPVFFGGLKIAATLAIIGTVVAEFYSSENGLGNLLLLHVSNGETAGAFASIIYLTVMGLLLFGLVALAEKMLVPAHMLKRLEEAGARPTGSA